jgi:hypothetical protein
MRFGAHVDGRRYLASDPATFQEVAVRQELDSKLSDPAAVDDLGIVRVVSDVDEPDNVAHSVK